MLYREGQQLAHSLLALTLRAGTDPRGPISSSCIEVAAFVFLSVQAQTPALGVLNQSRPTQHVLGSTGPTLQLSCSVMLALGRGRGGVCTLHPSGL